MRFNAFSFISPCIDDTKAFLKPLKFHGWLKMGLISFMSAGRTASSRVSMPAVRVPVQVFSGSGKGAGSTLGSTIGAVLSKLMYLMIPIVAVLFILMVLWNYLTSVFSFVFVECLETKKVLIRKPFNRNSRLGLSLFLFRFVLMIFVLILVGIAIVPVIMMIIAGKANVGAIIALVLSMMFYLMFFMVVMMLLSIFLFLVFNISFLHMYYKRMKIWASIRATFRVISKNLLEILVFWLARLCIGVAVGLISIAVFLVMLLPILLIFGPIGIGLFFAGMALSWSVPIVVIIVLVALASLTFISYVMNVILLPLSVYGTYFSIRNYKALMK